MDVLQPLKKAFGFDLADETAQHPASFKGLGSLPITRSTLAKKGDAMKGYILFGGFLLLFTTAAASAQTKASGTLKCDKPEPAYQIEVGDLPGHNMVLEKLSCTWVKPMDMAGDKAKDASVVVSVDVTATRSAASGAGVSTMESGDKAFTVIRDATVIKDGEPEPTQGTWSYSGGTGKLKGIIGKGTYKTTLNEDRTSTVEVEGEYELPKAKSPQGK